MKWMAGSDVAVVLGACFPGKTSKIAWNASTVNRQDNQNSTFNTVNITNFHWLKTMFSEKKEKQSF